MFNKAESTYEVQHDLDILCAFGNRYQEWLRQMEDDKNPDQYEQVCALFLHMSDDFQLFVDSYRSGDSILVERAYDWCVPVWAALVKRNTLPHTMIRFDNCLLPSRIQDCMS